MTEIFSQPDDAGPARASEAETSLWGRLGAQAADTLDPKDSLSGMWLARRAREANAAGTDQAVGAAGDLDVYSSEPLEQRQAVLDAGRAAIPDISQADAKEMLKQEGLTEQDVHLGDAPTHKLPVLKMQIDEAHTRRDRQAAIERGPQGFFPGALGLVTSLGVGMIDPVNVAAFSIPVIGEARMGKIIASAGDSILARGAARFSQGAAQGAVGTAALQPADWWLHTRDGQDYTMAQAMESIIMGAGMGGAFHAIPGGVSDVLARRRGLPLAGSPQDQLLRALAPADRTAEIAPDAIEQRAGHEELPGISAAIERAAAPAHPADVLADLPPAAREDAVHAAMADIISGRPTQAAEMLQIAADHDPRIAESLEALPVSRTAVDLAQDRADAEAATTKHVEAKKPAGRAAANPETWSLFEYLASRGGLKPDPELEAVFGNSRGPFVPGFGSLIRKGGMPLDEALRSAKDGRYLFDAADVTGAEGKLTPRDLLDKIDEENRKRRVYRVDHTPATDRVISREEEARHIVGALHTEIEAATGQSAVHIDPELEARVIEIVQREGIHDVMEAYERAIMEDRERYDAAAEARRADERDRFIPGWDVQDDAGAAPPRGEAVEVARGQAGSAGSGEGRAFGEQPRAPGAGDRTPAKAKLKSSPAEAAADPRWRALADTTPDYNDPETLAESEAADHVPEPESLVPERSLTALEKAAADAEEVWRKLEPTLTEKERALVHDVMNQLKLDAETRAKIITDGAACLVGAVG